MWNEVFTQPSFPACHAYRLLKAYRKWNAFTKSPEDMLLAIRTCPSTSVADLKCRNRFLMAYVDFATSRYMDMSTVATAVVEEFLQMLGQLRTAEHGGELRPQCAYVLNMLRHMVHFPMTASQRHALQTWISTYPWKWSNRMLLARIYHNETPLWFAMQAHITAVPQAAVFSQPGLLHYVSFLYQRRNLVHALRDWAQCAVDYATPEKIPLASLAALMHMAHILSPILGARILSLCIATMVHHVSKRTQRKWHWKHLLGPLSELWGRFKGDVSMPEAKLLTHILWKALADDYLTMADVMQTILDFCGNIEDANYWKWWLQEGVPLCHAAKTLKVKMMETVLHPNSLPWPEHLANSCYHVLLHNLTGPDDSLLAIARAWKYVFPVPQSAHKFFHNEYLNSLLQRMVTSHNSFLYKAFEIVVDLVCDGRTFSFAQCHMNLLQKLRSDSPSFPIAALVRLHSLQISPTLATLDQIGHVNRTCSNVTHLLRQLACISRMQGGVSSSRYSNFHKSVLQNLCLRLDSPQFSLASESDHLLAVSTQMRCNVGTVRVFLRLLKHVMDRNLVSVAVCEVGVALVSSAGEHVCHEFIPYFTECVMSMLMHGKTTVCHLIKSNTPLDVATGNAFCRLMSVDQVSNMILRVLAKDGSLLRVPAFARLVAGTGKLTTSLAKLVLFHSQEVQAHVLVTNPELVGWMQTDCGICMEPINGGASMLSCHYGYHRECLRLWWQTAGVIRDTCPACRSVSRLVPQFCGHEVPPLDDVTKFVDMKFYMSI